MKLINVPIPQVKNHSNHCWVSPFPFEAYLIVQKTAFVPIWCINKKKVRLNVWCYDLDSGEHFTIFLFDSASYINEIVMVVETEDEKKRYLIIWYEFIWIY